MPRRSKLPSNQPLPESAGVSLSPAEQRFVAEMLIDQNATRAYRAVHPNVTYAAARMAASRLVAKDNIRVELKAARQAQQRRTQISADGVLKELVRIAFSDPLYLCDRDDRMLPLHRVPLATRRAIASMKVKRERVTQRVTKNGKTRTTVTTRESVVEYRFYDKLLALSKLFDYLGLSAGLPPLEVVLSMFPADLAQSVRQALADDLTSKSQPKAG
jgi:phage terminase small subunit